MLVPIYQSTCHHTPYDNNHYFIVFSAGIPYSHQRSRRKKHISPMESSSLCYVRSQLHKLICLCLHAYLLTPWCRVLPEQLTGLQLVKKFPAFHGTRRFITALTSVRHLSLSWGSPIQSTCPHPTSWRSILILSTHLRLGLPSVAVLLLFYGGWFENCRY